MDKQEYDAILTGIRSLTQTASNEEFGELIDMRQDVRSWFESGAIGALPHEARLIELGVLSQPVGTSAAHSENSPPPPAIAPLTAEAAALPNGVAPADSAPIEPPAPAGPDPDDHLQERYEEGIAAMKRRQYAAAADIFSELQLQVRGRLKEDVDRLYTDANDKYAAEIQRAIDVARQSDQAARNDLKKRRSRWTTVLSLDPENDEARVALEQVAQDEAAKDFTRQLETLKGRVQYLRDKKLESDSLQKAGEFVAEIERLETVNPTSQEAQTLKQDILAIRDRIRAELGQASTLMASGDLKAAYVLARQQMDAGLLEIFDQATSTTMPTLQFFSQAREKLLAARRQVAAERQQRAAEQKDKGYPDAGKLVLEQARELLRDKEISEDDRETLKPQVDEIDRAIAEINLEIDKLNKAQALIAQSSKAPNPQKKLDLLIEARVEYPRHPTIEQEIANAEEGVTAVEGSRLSQLMDEARLKLERDKFDEARELIKKNHEELDNRFAAYLISHPATEDPPNLAQRLKEARALIVEISEQEETHKQLMQKVEAMHAALKSFDAGEAYRIAEINDTLESLSEEEEKHREVREVRRQLAKRQGHQENWRQGEQKYRSQHWQEAITYLEVLARSASAHREKAELWSKRANAMVLSTEAAEAYSVRNDWAAARSLYSQVKAILEEAGTGDGDPNQYTLERAREIAGEVLTELANLDDADRRVKEALREARTTFESARRAAKAPGWQQTMTAIPEFKTAHALVESAKAERSTMRTDLDTLGIDIRTDWHKAYLGAMKSHADSGDMDILTNAVRLADEAAANNLLWEADERMLVNQLRARRLDVVFDDLQHRQQWSEAEANRKARLEINVGKREEIERQYRDVLRKRVRADVDNVLRHEPESALQKLKEMLHQPELVTDVDLLSYAIELCWDIPDWVEAGRFAGRIENIPGYAMLGRVWGRLTHSAARFRDDPMSAMSELEALARDPEVNREPTLLSLVMIRRDEFIKRRVDELIEEARDAARQRSEDGLLKAAIIYATVLKLQQQEPRATDGLRDIGSQLKPGLESRCEQASSLNVMNAATLDKTLNQAKDLLTQLESISNVSDALRIDQNLKAELEDTITKLTRKHDIWSQVKSGLTQARREIDQALLSPSRTSGWELGSVLNSLTGVERNVPNEERACREMVRAELDRVRQLQEQGVELFEQIDGFMQIVIKEEFEQALSRIPALSTALTSAGGSERWGGLDHLLYHDYKYFGTRREARGLEEHRNNLTLSQRNANEWQQWAETVRAAQGEAEKLVRKLQPGFNALLDRGEMSLEAIIKLCKELQDACEKVEDQIAAKPKGSLLSERAREAEQSAVVEAAENTIRSQLDLARQIQNKAESSRTTFREKLRPLQQLMRQLEDQRRKMDEYESKRIKFGSRPVVSQATINSAKAALDSCRQIDPSAAEVIQYEQQLRSWGYLS